MQKGIGVEGFGFRDGTNIRKKNNSNNSKNNDNNGHSNNHKDMSDNRDI